MGPEVLPENFLNKEQQEDLEANINKTQTIMLEIPKFVEFSSATPTAYIEYEYVQTPPCSREVCDPNAFPPPPKPPRKDKVASLGELVPLPFGNLPKTTPGTEGTINLKATRYSWPPLSRRSKREMKVDTLPRTSDLPLPFCLHKTPSQGKTGDHSFQKRKQFQKRELPARMA